MPGLVISADLEGWVYSESAAGDPAGAPGSVRGDFFDGADALDDPDLDVNLDSGGMRMRIRDDVSEPAGTAGVSSSGLERSS